MNTLKDKKKDAMSLASLLAQLSPDERERLRQGIVIGKTIFKPINNKDHKMTS